ncbi:MAG: DMT family transporter [Gemmatimonadetes bacterium]|nr:DMT family transporter [Gemmatimonadota bacterium]
MTTPRLSPSAGMLLVTLFWGGNFTATKLAFAQIEPLAFTALRFLLATAVLWAILRVVEPAPAPLPRGAATKLIWLGVVGNTLYQLCFIEGLARTSATKSSLILAGMPAIVILATWLLGIERTTVRQRLAVLLATIGVVIVVTARGGTLGEGFTAGDAMLLGAIVTWAVYTLLLRHWQIPISSLRLTAWTMYTGTPGLVLLGIPQLLRTDWARVSWAGWGGILYAALLSLVAAYILWNRGVAKLGAARTVVFNCLVPLVATAIAIVGLGERPGLIHLVGGVLIVSGVLMTRQGGVPAEG